MSDLLLTQIATLRARLLDMTARNRLLNFPHPSRGSARFFGPSLDQAFAQLVSGRPLTIEPIAEPSRREREQYWRA